jgi:ABC-2 type transport system ATP-binding protein
VKIGGFDIMENPLEAKKCIGYLPEIPPLYVDMTVKSYLKFIFGLKGVKLPKEKHIKEVMEKAKIDKVSNRLIKNLSKGYRQRVGLAGALLGNPPILILDEPTVGLDPKQVIEIRDLIKELKKDRTVILSSHILTEVQAVCDRILIINQGKVVADDTADNLSAGIEKNHILYAVIEGNKNEVLDLIKSIPNVIGANCERSDEKESNVFEYKIESQRDADIRRELFMALASKSMPMLGLRTGSLSLEDIFLQITENSDLSAIDEIANSGELKDKSSDKTEDKTEEKEDEEVETPQLEDKDENKENKDEENEKKENSQNEEKDGGDKQ